MAFLGMRGTGDWVTDQRPLNWRETILYLYPNGDAPLTAVMSKMGSELTDDAEFNWWDKELPDQASNLLDDGIYLDPTLTTAYTTGGVTGDVLYAKMSAVDSTKFRAGHQVLLRNVDDYNDDTNAKVTGRVINGNNSYVSMMLLQDDPTTTGIASCGRLLIIGNINEEGAPMPEAIAYDPTKRYNLTQIWRTPLEITRTARKTRLRTGDAYKEAKRDCLEQHSIEMEKSTLWSIKTETVGVGGKPERTTQGLIPFIVDGGGVTSDYSTDSDFSGTTWLNGGEAWIDKQLEEMFRYGSDERLGFCGSGTILAINKLIKAHGNFDYTPMTTAYGIKVTEWVTPFGTIYLKRHPLFSYEPTNRQSLVLYEPVNLTSRIITDTTFYDDPEKKNTGYSRRDGTKEEYLTELGYEMHWPKTGAWLNGFGKDNP